MCAENACLTISPHKSLRTKLTVTFLTRFNGWNTRVILADPHSRMGGTPLSAGLGACYRYLSRVLSFLYMASHLRRERQSFIDMYYRSLFPRL